MPIPLKGVKEVVDERTDYDENVGSICYPSDVEIMLTQDRQSHCDELVRRIEEPIDIAMANLVFSGLSIARMDKIPKWLLENMEKNKTKFKEDVLTIVKEVYKLNN